MALTTRMRLRARHALRLLLSFTVLLAALALPVFTTPANAARPVAPSPIEPDPIVRSVATPGPTEVSGNITEDTVWGPQGSPYVLSGRVYVRDDVSLTLLPGAVVKGSPGNSGLRVEGQLLVLGQPGSRVVFTSLRDDTTGGDTNGDGDATSPAAGDWEGISVDHDDASAPMSVVDYADVRYAGFGPEGAISPRTCEGAGSVEVKGAGRLILSNSKIVDSQANALKSSFSDERAYVGIHNNEFSGGRCGVFAPYGVGDFVVSGPPFFGPSSV